MKKTALALSILLSACFINLEAQTLFSYGKNEVSKQEFLRAYNKNGYEETSNEKAYREYLDLYIRFKLKVQAAYDQKMDTLPNQRAELQSFRNQVVESFMNDDQTLQTLVNEAFQRSQKEIHLAHIFIPFNPADTAKAFKRATDAYAELKRGTDFGNVASIYSADSSVVRRQGDIGYITVFTLPYVLENLAYSLTPGSYSKPYRTKAGYHIFKNIDERKALGKMRAAQILLAFPPGADAVVKNKIKSKADSLYTALQKGERFDSLALKFSSDNFTYQSGGEIPPFTTGTYDPEFEKAAFAINKNGSITKPVLTVQGYHIIKRLDLLPVNANKDSADAIAVLRQQVINDSRMQIAKAAMIQKAYEVTKLNKSEYDEKKLMDYYRDHLETYNPEFALQMNEFKDGNLLFEIMQSAIWDKAGNDTIGLKNYYEAHKQKYKWEPSADVIIFTCNDAATATAIRTAFSINTASWRDIMKANEEKAQADSGRYELAQLPVKDTSLIKAGIITPLVTNAADNTTSFVYVRKIYNERTARDFNESKGFVLNDYQLFLEDQWIRQLKKKYPVVVHEGVLKGL